MNIFGLNIASNKSNKNGCGGIDLVTRKFEYVPIEEESGRNPFRPIPTFADLGLRDVKFPNRLAHHDPEFSTFTYGHVKRGYGDDRLWQMRKDDILFFYATLDLLPTRKDWGVFIIGYFCIESVRDVRDMTPSQIRKLKGFENNAHVKRSDPAVHLLIKGSRRNSRIYKHAILLSSPENPRRLNPKFERYLRSVTGKSPKGKPWYRWVLHTSAKSFANILQRNQ